MKNYLKKDYLYFSDFKKDLLKNPKIRKEWYKLDVEFAPIEAILKARVKKGLTQKEIARKMKTKQSAISRVESGRVSPTISFLQKLADALGARLQIKFAGI